MSSYIAITTLKLQNRGDLSVRKVAFFLVASMLFINSPQPSSDIPQFNSSFVENSYLSASQPNSIHQSFSFSPPILPLKQDNLYYFRTAIPFPAVKTIPIPKKAQSSLYQTIEDAVYKREKSVSYIFEKELSAKNLKKVSNDALNRLRREHPDYFLNNTNSFTYSGISEGLYNKVTFNLGYFPITYSEQEILKNEIDLIVSKATGSTVDKLRYFHDTIVNRCEYDYTAAKSSSREYPNAFNVYGALIEGNAVCQGYAAAFKMLCDAAEIPNWIVTGDTDVPHAWNYVNLDGEFYLIDSTKDDTGKESDRYTYFLVGSDTTSSIYKEDGSAPGELAEKRYQKNDIIKRSDK